MINTFETSKIPDEELLELVKTHFDMRPAAIIKHLDLLRPIYRKAAVFGHFGRDDPDFTWEKTDKAERLKKAAELHLNNTQQVVEVNSGNTRVQLS